MTPAIRDEWNQAAAQAYEAEDGEMVQVKAGVITSADVLVKVADARADAESSTGFAWPLTYAAILLAAMGLAAAVAFEQGRIAVLPPNVKDRP